METRPYERGLLLSLRKCGIKLGFTARLDGAPRFVPPAKLLCYYIFMGEFSLPVLFNTIIFLLVPFIGGYLALKFKLPAIVGYIVGGIILGIFLKEQFSSDFLSHFAGIGVILLLFTVGLEMNIGNLRRFGRIIVLGGLCQVFLTSFFFFFAFVGCCCS